MKNFIPPGGHKHKSWRLKKKRHKWFVQELGNTIVETLKEVPLQLFQKAFNHQTYNMRRLWTNENKII